jgi:hypothetical protein
VSLKLSTTQSKPHEFATGEGKTKTSKAQLFSLKVLLKEKITYLFIFYVFVHIAGGQSFLMYSEDQTSLQSVLCPISDFFLFFSDFFLSLFLSMKLLFNFFCPV